MKRVRHIVTNSDQFLLQSKSAKQHPCAAQNNIIFILQTLFFHLPATCNLGEGLAASDACEPRPQNFGSGKVLPLSYSFIQSKCITLFCFILLQDVRCSDSSAETVYLWKWGRWFVNTLDIKRNKRMSNLFLQHHFDQFRTSSHIPLTKTRAFPYCSQPGHSSETILHFGVVCFLARVQTPPDTNAERVSIIQGSCTWDAVMIQYIISDWDFMYRFINRRFTVHWKLHFCLELFTLGVWSWVQSQILKNIWVKADETNKAFSFPVSRGNLTVGPCSNFAHCSCLVRIVRLVGWASCAVLRTKHFTQRLGFSAGFLVVGGSLNLALNKVAYQSSTSYDGFPDRAVGMWKTELYFLPSDVMCLHVSQYLVCFEDGNLDPIYNHGSCSHTRTQHGSWWLVDLGQRFNINKVQITNRDSYGVSTFCQYFVEAFIFWKFDFHFSYNCFLSRSQTGWFLHQSWGQFQQFCTTIIWSNSLLTLSLSRKWHLCWRNQKFSLHKW